MWPATINVTSPDLDSQTIQNIISQCYNTGFVLFTKLMQAIWKEFKMLLKSEFPPNFEIITSSLLHFFNQKIAKLLSFRQSIFFKNSVSCQKEQISRISWFFVKCEFLGSILTFINCWMDERADRRTDRRPDWQTDRETARQIDRQRGGQRWGQTVGQTGGQMEIETEGRNDARTLC